MVSVVIAAHDEASVIGRCLEALAGTSDLDLTVVPNGCTDATAEVARAAGARVVEIAEASKVAALNAGDRQSAGFPRLYLDADIELSGAGLLRLAEVLAANPQLCVVVPGRTVDLTGSPLLVRAYFAINSRLPVYRDGIFGRGAIMLSRSARGRFDQFPDVVADDLFLDSLFAAVERLVVSDVQVVVAAPRTTRALLRRLIRVRRGNTELRSKRGTDSQTSGVRRSRPWSWFTDVVVPEPRLLPAGLVYAALTLTAAGRARLSSSGGRQVSWSQDRSTRSAGRSRAFS